MLPRYPAEKSGLWWRSRAGDSVRGHKADQGEMFMSIRSHMLLAASAVAGMLVLAPAHAQETVKIGLILPMTGGQASIGKQIDNAVKLYMQQNGDTVAGKKIEIILKDDGAVPDNTKRLAQELIVNDKVHFIAGFGVTPAALAAAPLATQAKVPEIVMAAGTSIITERSPYIVRTSFTLAQSSTIIGDWAAKNGIKKVATLTSDFAPGNDALNFFKQNFTAGGGEIVEEVKVPLQNPDFAPFLQRMKDSKPDAVFVFVPAGQGGSFMKQYAERGLDKAGIKVIGPGEAMKGMKWESPRGPISIDPESRDIVQNIYIRKVEKVDGELYNVEFATFEAVKDSGKTKK